MNEPILFLSREQPGYPHANVMQLVRLAQLEFPVSRHDTVRGVTRHTLTCPPTGTNRAQNCPMASTARVTPSTPSTGASCHHLITPNTAPCLTEASDASASRLFMLRTSLPFDCTVMHRHATSTRWIKAFRNEGQYFRAHISPINRTCASPKAQAEAGGAISSLIFHLCHRETQLAISR